MKFSFLHFVSLFLLMLVTGVFWGTWFTLTRSIESFSSEEFIHIGKVIIANVAMPMRFLMPACILFMLLSTMLHTNKYSNSFYFGVTALIFIFLALLITLIILVPIDNDIKIWTADTVPAEWEQIRNKWKIFHFIRTMAALASFACFSISVLTIKSYKN